MEQLIYQRQQYGCGIACVKMALAYYSGNKACSYIEEPHLTHPMSLSDLLSFAASYGLKLEGYRGDFRSAPEGSLILLYGSKGSHMAFFLGKKGKRYILLDPDAGRLALEEETLGSIYAGTYLQKTSFEPKLGRYFQHTPFPFDRTTFALASLSFLPNLLMLSSLFLLGMPNIHIGFSILFLALSLLSSALSRRIVLFLMRRFDEKYLICFSHKADWGEAFKHYQAYKGLLFSASPQFFASLATLLSSACLLSFVDPYLGCAIIIGIGLVMASHLLSRKRRNEIESDLIVEERKLFFPFEEDKLPILKKISASSDTYGKKYLSSELFCVALAILFSVLLLLLERRLIAGNLFIYGISLYYCFSSAFIALGYEKKKEQKKKEEGYFIHEFARSQAEVVQITPERE